MDSRLSPTYPGELGGVIGIDVDVLCRQIRCEETHCGLAPAELNANIADGLGQVLVRLLLVERV